MKYFSAQYVYTNSSALLKRPVITTLDDGTIVEIEDTGGDLTERHSVPFYNGIIVPGFINCHCHLELSHMNGKIAVGKGLGPFIAEVRNTRGNNQNTVKRATIQADNEMFEEGIVICADVCNTPGTFEIKKKSSICYINLLEVFGIDNSKAQTRIDEILSVAGEAEKENLKYNIVPHSVYSVSEHLFDLIRKESEGNTISSIHFLESESERTFLESKTGPIMDSYKGFGILTKDIRPVESHLQAILKKMTRNGSLLLVHNTFVTREEIKSLKSRTNLFWCICPRSNLYIEMTLPPVNLMIEENCQIVIGTDSKGSNKSLSILDEMKTIQTNFPMVTIEMLIKWATLNGAMALGEDSWAGSIEPGKKPGLVLISDFDFENHRLLKTSIAKRLI